MEVAVGLDVGGTKILALALDVSSGRTVATRQFPTPQEPPALRGALIDAVTAALGETEDEGSAVAIGVGVPGFLGLDGIARQAPNLPGAVGVDLRSMLAERFGVAVVVDNDANCAAWAARLLDAPDAESLVAVTLGTGIGAGLVIAGELIHGAHGFAGEPGHMIVDVGGWECRCGQHGCWEMYASGNGLGRLAQAAVDQQRGGSLLAAAGSGPVDGALVGRLASEGVAEALAVLDEYAGWVGVGLANLVNLLDPAVVVLGGGVVGIGEPLRSRVEAALAAYPTVGTGRDVVVRLSSLGPTAGALGAAQLAWKSVSGGGSGRR